MATNSKFVPPHIPVDPTAGPRQIQVANTGGSSTNPGNDTWDSVSLNFNFLSDSKKAVAVIQEFLGTLNKIAGLLSSVLKLVEVFTNDFKSLTSLLKVLVSKALASISAFLKDLENTGVYVLTVLPEFNEQNAAYFPPGGGFNGFKQKVTGALFNTKDPNRPDFSATSSVGGFVLVLSADTTDPAAIADLIENLRVLSNFFAGLLGSSQPASPVNVRAIPGLYSPALLDVKSSTVTVGQQLRGGALNLVGISKKPGIKITWEDNPSLSVLNTGQATTKYYVYRSTQREGTVLGNDGKVLGKDGKKPDLANAKLVEGKFIKVFGNEGYTDKDLFNNGKARIVYNSPLDNVNEIIDFDVLDGKEYFYVIVPAFGDVEESFLDNLDRSGFFAGKFGLPSPVVSAKSDSCIPETALNWIEYPGGKFVTVREGSGPFWETATVKSLLGPQTDKIIKSLTDMVNVLGASVENSNSSLQDFQRSFKKRIQNYLKIIDKIKRLLVVLESYKLVGSVLALNLSIEKGGIENFAKRFNSAKIKGPLEKLNPITGIATGVVVLFGKGSVDGNEAVRNFNKQNEYSFIQDPFSNTSKQADSTGDNAMNLIMNIFSAKKK